MHYLSDVLRWLYAREQWMIAVDFNIYRDPQELEPPVAPDLAVFHGVVDTEERQTLRSWRLYQPNSPPPTVVFEFSSATTWAKDLDTKPAIYADMGVHEYYAYDPNVPPVWTEATSRVRGWWLHTGTPILQPFDAHGRLWSQALQSWLVPDGLLLRLYDANNRLRLTKEEAERAAKERERAAKERERAAKEAALAAKEQERAAKEAALVAKEQERAAKEAAWAKLRELGIDPESLMKG
jgi:hypothetical protein